MSQDPVKERIIAHLQTGRMMQIATERDGQPWCCTVYFVPNETLNLYWISTPERRHSKEILHHAKVAAAIPIKHVPGSNVVGVQIEGDATIVDDLDEIKKVIRLYADRYSTGQPWYDDFIAGKNKHKLFRLVPRLFVLFDEEAFPEDTRKEWKPSKTI